MTDTRTIYADAAFMIVYIGLSAAMACLTIALAMFLLLELSFGPLQVAAAALNVLGWSVLPFAPRLYKTLVGRRFDWRANGAFDGAIEA
jgi:hypothetical protein